jgi:hypothetical protein
MVSTYVNDLRLNELATGDGSGTWGDTTNTNLELIGEALSFGTEAITTNADTHTSTVADGATDPARSMYIKYTGTLDSACTITIAPNTLSRLHFIENATSGSQNIIIKQGSGATVTIGPGDVKSVYLDGAGSGAAVVDAFASLSVVDLKVGDDLTLNSDDAVISFGADADIKIIHHPDNGLFLKSTATGDDTPFILTLQTGDTDIAANDQLGVINFQAPDEAAGTDAVLAAAGIEAVSEGDFSASSNATSLIFKTASSEAAAEKMRINSSGLVNIGANSATSVAGMALKVESTGNVQQLLKAGTNFNSTIDFGDQDANDTGEIKYAHNGDFMAFKTNGAEAVKIDSSKRVQIGNVDASATTSAKNDAILTLVESGSANPVARIAFDSGDSDVSNGVKVGYTAATFAPDFEISNGDAGIIRFSTNNTERIRIMSGGNVGFGTTAPDVPLHVKGGSSVESAIIVDSTGVGGGHKYGIRPGSPSVSNGYFTIHDEVNDATRFTITDGGIVGIGTASPSGGTALDVRGTGVLQLNNTDTVQLIASSGSGTLKNVASSPLIFGTVNTERMRIDTSGRLLCRKTATGLTSPGVETHAADNGFLGTTSTGAALHVNRQSSDGTLVTFRHDNTSEGSITVSGSTVSYNGGHLSRWSQASDGNRIDGLVKGTVMTNLDKMAVWTSEDGKTKNNEQLNCMAVSSVEGDANVAGVFVNFNEDHDLDDPYAKSCVNDMNIAMTGDMVVRIASGTTIARGDLLMSAGDGTAKPQGDDIVRSKTIAKVTSTNVSHTYSDGSYLVPCVLMAC